MLFQEFSFIWFPAILYFILVFYNKTVYTYFKEMATLILLSWGNKAESFKKRSLILAAKIIFWNSILILSISGLYSLMPNIYLVWIPFPAFWWALFVFILGWFVRKKIKIE